eukprot:4543165-Pleurochrysis_carterae.AAC.1
MADATADTADRALARAESADTPTERTARTATATGGTAAAATVASAGRPAGRNPLPRRRAATTAGRRERR